SPPPPILRPQAKTADSGSAHIEIPQSFAIRGLKEKSFLYSVGVEISGFLSIFAGKADTV
ncbi:MAG: hypothetical protein K2O78_02060, partial [Muribaculaceae bacterium]|nr:hypothetical protein [Muribaculaceae bacterium]